MKLKYKIPQVGDIVTIKKDLKNCAFNINSQMHKFFGKQAKITHIEVIGTGKVDIDGQGRMPVDVQCIRLDVDGGYFRWDQFCFEETLIEDKIDLKVFEL